MPFGFFLQHIQILNALQCEILGEDEADLLAPSQAELGNGFAVFHMLHHFISGEILLRHFHRGHHIAHAFELAIAVKLEAALGRAAQKPVGHQAAGRLFGVGQAGFQSAQGFAQLGEQVFRLGRGSIVHQQIAVFGVENRLAAAAAGKGARQQIIGNLLF